jgi:threonine synthase
VAQVVYEKYREATGDNTKAVVISTASPYKFNASVARAVLDPAATAGHSEFALLELLSQFTGRPIPPALAGLEYKTARHTLVVEPDKMKEAVRSFLG